MWRKNKWYFSLQGELFPQAPFDFSKSLDFVSMFAPSEGEQTVSGLSFTRAFSMKIESLPLDLKMKVLSQNQFYLKLFIFAKK